MESGTPISEISKSMGIDTVVEIYQPYYDEYRSNLQ